MELNLSSYQKQKLKKAWFYDTGEKIKLNSKHVKKTNTDYYGLFPSLSIRNANKVFRQMENNKGAELSLSKKEVENLVLKALSDDDIKQYVKKLKIPNFRNVYLNLNELPKKIRKNECGIVNLFFHWVCYFKNKNHIYYFDSVGGDAPIELKNYFRGNRLIMNTKKVQKKGDPAICGYLCIIILYLLGVKKIKWEDIIKTIGIGDIKDVLYYKPPSDLASYELSLSGASESK